MIIFTKTKTMTIELAEKLINHMWDTLNI
jgi:hypothetical protein